MPVLAIFSWNQFTTPPALAGVLTTASHANDPATPTYVSGTPSWIGETFTFNGGAPTEIVINDDDGNFEDAYVETGGPQTLDQAVTINGVSYPAGTVVQNEFSMLDAAGNEIYVVNIGGTNVGFAYRLGEEPAAGETFTATQGRDGDPADNAPGEPGSEEPYANIVCFAEGTMILTPKGERPVESLRPGMLVETLDHGPQPVRWLHRDHQPLDDVAAEDKPVLVRAGALAPGRPARDLVVSAHHRLFVGGGTQLDHLFASELLAPARALAQLPRIRLMRGKRAITWVHFACDRHEIVFANGALAESLLLGPMVLNRLSAQQRARLAQRFRRPAEAAWLHARPARPCLSQGDATRALFGGPMASRSAA